MNLLLIVLVVSLGGYCCYALFFLTGLWRLRPPEAREGPVPTVSVIVAARNEAEHLPDLLADLAQQDYPAGRLEIVVADDRSTDGTWDIIQDFERRLPRLHGIRIHEPVPFMTPKKYALTRAIEGSTGDIILCTDADCRVPPTWVSSMVRAFREDTGIVVGFSAVIRKPDTRFVRYQALDFLALMAADAGSLGWGRAWSGSAQNLAYRRSYFQAIEGFRPVAQQRSGDDFYLVQAISRLAGAVFNAAPDSFVRTAPVPTLRAFLSQRVRWASNARDLFRTDRFFLLFLGTAFCCNAALLSGLLTPALWSVLPAAFSLKFVFDALVIFSGANKFRVMVEPLTFVTWSLVQPVYIPLVGILGLLGKFRWKEG
jgi:cellulose synthase/poly-beta-1,6-N-acetylglucosamine synthase-like glycosyltransferase